MKQTSSSHGKRRYRRENLSSKEERSERERERERGTQRKNEFDDTSQAASVPSDPKQLYPSMKHAHST